MSEGTGVVRRVAGWVADRQMLPTSQRAVFGHYAATGEFDRRALTLKRAVDDALDRMLADLFDGVGAALAEAFDADGPVSFDYETKLTLPAELTLGYLYRRASARARDGYDPLDDDPETDHDREVRAFVDRAEAVTDLVVTALIDGDLRDALNDEEYDDFEVSLDPAEAAPDAESPRRRVGEVAQEYLQRETERKFEEYPEGVREAYDRAVDVSERHQREDDRFRSLFAAAADGDATARERIESAYKFADFPDDDHPFTDAEADLPYLKTQYDRVGVIYDGMVDMYVAAGFDVPTAFKNSIVLAIVGAQIWLDDVDDYRDDVAEGQLTPVTAEYVLASDDHAAYAAVVDVAAAYFDRAREYATAASSPLNGIAIEYILRSGEPERLPGSDA